MSNLQLLEEEEARHQSSDPRYNPDLQGLDMTENYTSGVFLSLDIIGGILSRLPAKYVARLRCVCKDWMSLTYDPCFLMAQQKLAAFAMPVFIFPGLSHDERIALYDFKIEDMILKCRPVHINFEGKNVGGNGSSTRLSNSVNGLVFGYRVIPDIERYCFLLNPTTREFTTIQMSQMDRISWCFGLGYDASTGKYKLISLYKLRGLAKWSCEVLTLGTSEWRHVEVPYKLPQSRPVPILVNAMLHWNQEYIDDKSDFRVNMLTFDIKDEKFGMTTSSVTTIPVDDFNVAEFQEWRGHLSVTIIMRDNNYLEIWMLKDRASGMWSKEYSLAFTMFTDSSWGTRVLPVTDEKLLVRWNRRAYLYDIRSQTFHETKHYQFVFGTMIHRESLLSPRQLHGQQQELTEISRRTMQLENTKSENSQGQHRERRAVVAKECARASKTAGSVFLPLDIIGDILPRLPAKLVARLRLVCKDWMSLAYDPYFLKAHLKRALCARPIFISHHLSIDKRITFYDFKGEEYIILKEWLVQINFEDKNRLDDVDITLSNSVNGLVCAYQSYYRNNQGYCYLLNPTTGESTSIRTRVEMDLIAWRFGLGYDVSTGQYKLINLYNQTDRDCYSCDVLTLGTGEWRYVGEVTCPRNSSWFLSIPIFVNGALHWSWINIIGKTDEVDFRASMLTFDIKYEKLGLTTSSITERPRSGDRSYAVEFLEWRGHLCFILKGSHQDYFEIWMLKDHATNTWSKECSIRFPYSAKGFRLLPLTDEKLLIRTAGGQFLRDFRSQTLREMQYFEIEYDPVIHRESLISPRQVVSVNSSKPKCSLKC